MKFSIKDFSSKKSLMENLIFCLVYRVVRHVSFPEIFVYEMDNLLLLLLQLFFTQRLLNCAHLAH